MQVLLLTISIGKLKALQPFHFQPINQIVSLESKSPNLKEGFPLRCFQRLSRRNVATRRCR